MTESQTRATPTKASFKDVGHMVMLVKGINAKEKIPVKISTKPELHIKVKILSRNERTTLSSFSMAIFPITKNCTYDIPYKINVKFNVKKLPDESKRREDLIHH
ncbi:MAG: hypothetical protein HYT64_01575 [Candidatus Yanofskybacteria bacterium]|nr:hypothetical protein [Candidatus Yanofskybacteria bacterium]